MPSWPFSPHTTFVDNSVPKVTATHVNDWESAQNALFWQTYLTRPQCRVYCTDGATIYGSVSPVLIRDLSTSKYVYVAAPSLSVSPADLETPAMSWPTSTWLYLYAKCTSGVIGWEVSTTAPVATTPDGTTTTASYLFKNGDVTRRFVAAFYTNGSSVVKRFQRIDNETVYLDYEQVVPASAGNTSWQTAYLTTYTPPHAQEVDLCGILDNYAAAHRYLYLTHDGDAPSSPRFVMTRPSSLNSDDLTVFLASQAFRWKTDSNSLDHEVRVSVRRWRD